MKLKPLDDVLFASFVVSWIITRNYLFIFYVLIPGYGIVDDGWTTFVSWMFGLILEVTESFTADATRLCLGRVNRHFQKNTFTKMFEGLHLYWLYAITGVIRKMIKNGGVEDQSNSAT